MPLTFLLLTACGGGGGSDTDTTSTGPSVVSLSPIDNATGVATSAVLSITFDKAVNDVTLTSSSFTLEDNEEVTGVIAYDAATFTATFTPSVTLASNTLHTATLTTSITGSEGTPLTQAYSITFTTADTTSTEIATFDNATFDNSKWK